jgi:hypothetical protein
MTNDKCKMTKGKEQREEAYGSEQAEMARMGCNESKEETFGRRLKEV